MVAAREEHLVEISRLCKEYGITKCAKVVRGGESRVHSVLLAALEAGDAELLAVQDGARPLTTPELIDQVIALAERCGAAAPAVAVKDTVKAVNSDDTVERTLDRSTLRAIQTPQVFQADLLKAALQAALESGADDHRRLLRRGAAGQDRVPDRGGRGQPEDHHPHGSDPGGGAAAGPGGWPVSPENRPLTGRKGGWT